MTVSSYKRRPALKPLQMRIRVADIDSELIDQLGGRVMTPPTVASMLVAAALDAIRANPRGVTFPPRFIVDTTQPETPSLNDKPKK